MWKGNYAIKTLPLCITSRSSVAHLRQKRSSILTVDYMETPLKIKILKISFVHDREDQKIG